MMRQLKSALHMIAWEVTRRCNLNCLHCRAAAEKGPYQGELDTKECFSFIDEVASFSRPVVILTGGEPLLREDIFEIAAYGNNKGLRMVMAVNGTLLDSQRAVVIRQAGIQRVSISLDGATPESHDRLRGVDGAFAGALEGIKYLQEAGIPFQINTTVMRGNLAEIERIMRLAVDLGATAHHIFLLVPTGRGKGLAGEEVSAEDYERILVWFAEQNGRIPLQLKATCAPQYYRILHQRGLSKGIKRKEPLHTFTRGCLGGISFCFISHQGDCQPCGYLEVLAGNIRERAFQEVWQDGEVFMRLRNLDLLGGKCAWCEYKSICGGCRARAYEATGDYMGQEPLCPYEPVAIGVASREEPSCQP